MSDGKNINAPNLTPEQPEKEIKEGWSKFWSGSVAFFKRLTDLRNGLDREGTIVNIKNNKRMQGANAWLLMCSIMIASLGLDLNSPAVIIGAMLISPLMSPILGVGLAVGINDEKTLAISLQHFGIAIAIAVITSTLYFYFTPFGDETDEIIARTAPTLLDVAVAFFGGIAGIISGSRKDKSNAIPGVAIATALMPPLCVTGYGIANGNWVFMFNSFYLFFMNATFVALATFIIVRFLDFPVRKHRDEAENKRIRWMIVAFSLFMILPSGYIFSKVITQSNQERIIKRFVKEKFPNAMYDIQRLDNTDSVEVKMYVVGSFFKPETIAAYQDTLSRQGAQHCHLNFLQDDESRKDIDELKAKNSSAIVLAEQSREDKANFKKEIAQLNYQIDSLSSDTLLFRKMTNELKILFPELETISLSKNANSANLSSGQQSSIPVLFLDWEKAKTNTAKRKIKEQEENLVEFVKVRVGLDTVKVAHE